MRGMYVSSGCVCADLGGGGHYISGSRGTAERRSLLEVNHNKAITKKLVSAVHYQQVIYRHLHRRSVSIY